MVFPPFPPVPTPLDDAALAWMGGAMPSIRNRSDG
jgi:hypothetical protein